MLVAPDELGGVGVRLKEAPGASESEASEAKQRRGICDRMEFGCRGRTTLYFEITGAEGRSERRATWPTVVKMRTDEDILELDIKADEMQ